MAIWIFLVENYGLIVENIPCLKMENNSGAI